jgi:parallel beta-helix repeat protein
LLKNNRIHDGKHAGVLFFNKATATLEDNEINSNAQPGVVVRGEGSQALLTNNRIYDVKDAGFCVEGKATTTLEDNDIHFNTGPGVGVRVEASQALLKNKVTSTMGRMQLSILMTKSPPLWRTTPSTPMQGLGWLSQMKAPRLC